MKSARRLKAAGLWILEEAWGRSGSEWMRTAVAPRYWGVASQAVDATVSIISDSDCTSTSSKKFPLKMRHFPKVKLVALELGLGKIYACPNPDYQIYLKAVK